MGQVSQLEDIESRKTDNLGDNVPAVQARSVTPGQASMDRARTLSRQSKKWGDLSVDKLRFKLDSEKGLTELEKMTALVSECERWAKDLHRKLLVHDQAMLDKGKKLRDQNARLIDDNKKLEKENRALMSALRKARAKQGSRIVEVHIRRKDVTSKQ